MTVWRYGPSKHGLTVDAVNDGAVPLFRNLGTVMMVHDGTVDGYFGIWVHHGTIDGYFRIWGPS
jgi:hypothetical protein